jgi:hypothetical protein
MYSKVKLLRQRGARRPDRDIASDLGAVGHLTLSSVGAMCELKLHGPEDDSQRNPLIPVLLDATLITMHGARMLFRGFERQGAQDDPAGPACLQEWAVEVMVDQPKRQ